MLTLTLTAARLREERGKSIEKVVACEGTTNRIDLIVIIHISCLSMLEFLHIFNLFEYPKHFILTTDVRCKPRDLSGSKRSGPAGGSVVERVAALYCWSADSWVLTCIFPLCKSAGGRVVRFSLN